MATIRQLRFETDFAPYFVSVPTNYKAAAPKSRPGVRWLRNNYAMTAPRPQPFYAPTYGYMVAQCDTARIAEKLRKAFQQSQVTEEKDFLHNIRDADLSEWDIGPKLLFPYREITPWYQMREWMNANLTGEVMVFLNLIERRMSFEKEDDYILTKMRWK